MYIRAKIILRIVKAVECLGPDVRDFFVQESHVRGVMPDL